MERSKGDDLVTCDAGSNAVVDRRARSAFAAAHTDVSFGPRPQDRFEPPVDNSNAPFRPRLDHWVGFQVAKQTL